MNTTRARHRAATVALAAGLAFGAVGCAGSGPSPFASGGFEGQGSEAEPSGTGGDDAAQGGESREGVATVDLSPEEISVASYEALLTADSMRMATTEGMSAVGFSFDLHLDRAGTCAGSVTMPGMGSVELLMRDDSVWMKPDTEFWESTAGTDEQALIGLVDGSYLRGDTSDPELAEMAEVCDYDTLWEDSGPGGSAEASVTADEVTDHDGVPVIPITEREGDEVSEILVAAEGEPYPVLVRTWTDGMAMEVAFSGWNEPVPFEEPPADQVLDMSDFRDGSFAV
ncbi:hypothetical protein [Streptomyces marincola]|uniref:hypothetical protein n=1 Tax=Streptomyces marincola TaxID=2878388 RepID=UPI00131BA9EB|nr:hypothetical protein [Streptomyces marincola]